MAYTKPKFEAQNSAHGSYAAGCPAVKRPQTCIYEIQRM